MPPPDNAHTWVTEQWRVLCAHAPMHMAVFDREVRFIAASASWIADYEDGREDLAGQCYYDLHPDAPAHWQAIHQRVLQGEICQEDNERFQLDDGREFWNRWTCTPWRTPDGGIGGFVVSLNDLTRERRTQKRLTLAEQELHLALDSARAGTWEVDLATGNNKWSPETWRLYGLHPGQAESSSALWAETIVPEDRERINQAAWEALNHRREVEAEWQVNLPNEERWLLARGRPIVEIDGAIERYIGVVIDVTAQKILERHNLGRAIEFGAILDAVPVGIARIGRDLRYRFVNRIYETYYAKSPDAIIGMHVGALIGPDALAYAMPSIERVLAGTPQTLENQVTFADGKKHSVQVSLVPDRSVGGEVEGYFVVSSDISRLREQEVELNQMRDRLDQLTRRQVAHQTLIAVAHELRQPLHAAALFAEATRKAASKIPAEKPLAKAAGRTLDEIQRASLVLTHLFDTVRDDRGEEDGIDLDLSDQVRAVVAQLKARSKLSCLSLALDASPLPVRANPAALEKILVNLARNATEACGCGDTCPAKACITIRTYHQDGQAHVVIEDNGGGIPPKLRPNLFEPFQTGKPNGLGLGLSISRHLAVQQHGRLWHEDRPGGSAFYLALPLHS